MMILVQQLNVLVTITNDHLWELIPKVFSNNVYILCYPGVLNLFYIFYLSVLVILLNHISLSKAAHAITT